MTVIQHDDSLGRKVRKGNWTDQVVSTYQKILLSINNEHWDDAHAYLDFFIEEARICYELYCSWAIYKELDKVPAAAYQRLGHNKPDEII